MSRYAYHALGIVTLIGLAAAIVSAQEGTSYSRYSPSEPAASSLSDAAASTTSSSRRTAASSSRSGSLADRLKSIQKTVVDDYGDTAVQGESQLDPTPEEEPQPLSAREAVQAESAGASRLPSVLKRPIANSPAPAQPVTRSATDSVAPPPRAATLPVTRSLGEDSSSRRTARLQTPQRIENESITDSASRRPAPAGAVITVSGVGPALQIETKGPRAIVIGAEASYTITLSNQSSTEASDVYVRVILPDFVDVGDSNASQGVVNAQKGEGGKRELIWSVPYLGGRRSENLTVAVTPRANRPFELKVDWTLRPVSVTAQIEVQQPALELNLSGPSEARYGESTVCTITVSNPGTGPAENVMLEIAPGRQAADSRRIGSLAPGEQKNIEIELTAEAAGTLELLARATADGGLNAQAAHTLQVRRAMLEVRLEGPPLKFAGSGASYQVVVANTGDAVARDVEAALAIPTGANYLSGIEGAKKSAQGLVWQVGDVEAGAERVFTFNCELTTAGENIFQVRVQNAAKLAAATTLATKVEAIADLKLLVNDPPGPKPVGEEVVYEVKVVNRGAKAAELVHVVAQFSEGIEPTSVEGAEAEIADGQVLFRPIARIAAGQEILLRVKARADVDGNHRFRAEVMCDEPETRLVAEDTTVYFGAAARVGRSTSRSGSFSTR